VRNHPSSALPWYSSQLDGGRFKVSMTLFQFNILPRQKMVLNMHYANDRFFDWIRPPLWVFALTIMVGINTSRASDIAIAKTPETMMESEKMVELLNFARDTSEPLWIAVNDDVMGGRSSSLARVEGGKLRFEGRLSLENNGGFASIRTIRQSFNLVGTSAFVLRVMGDGRDYQLRIASSARFRGSAISYGATFQTVAGRWIEIVVPVENLKPSYRGNALSGPALDLADVRELGLLIGDKREGEFSLSVDWIKRVLVPGVDAATVVSAAAKSAVS
jgi:NADH dehydrogenase [ubiquinone] 1 alpha subcomplex assembly factor 1